MFSLPSRRKPLFATPRVAVALFALLALGCAGTAVAEHSMRHAMGGSGPKLDFPADRAWVEVPFRIEMNKIIIPLRVNGSEPLDFVFDTGAASAVMLDVEAASAIDFEVFGQAHIQGAGHGGDVPPADVAGNVTYDVGGLSLSGAQLVVMRGEGLLGGTHWQGIVGRQFLDALVVEIDWQKETLRFADPERFEAPAKAKALPLERQNGHSFVDAELVLGDGPVQPVRLVIDSGAFHALALDERRFDAIPGPRIEDAKLGRGINGVIRGSIARVGELRLAGFSLGNVITRFPDAELADIITSGSDGNLGAEVLRRFVVTFDYSRSQMLLQPTDALGDPFLFSTVGLAIHPSFTDDGAAVVDDLYPDSPATRAGLEEGDEIVSIDGRSPEAIGKESILTLFEQEPGTHLELELRRDGKIRAVRLTAERLL